MERKGQPLPPEWRDPKGPLRPAVREAYDLDEQRRRERADLYRRRRPYIIGVWVGIAMTIAAILGLLAKVLL